QLRVQMNDEKPQTIHLPKEKANEVSASSRVDFRQTQEQAPQPPAAHATLAEDSTGGWTGGSRPAAVPAGALGPQWRATGDGRHRDDGRLAPAVLPARREGAEGDAPGAGPVDGGQGGRGGVPGSAAGGIAGAGETIGNRE